MNYVHSDLRREVAPDPAVEHEAPPADAPEKRGGRRGWMLGLAVLFALAVALAFGGYRSYSQSVRAAAATQQRLDAVPTLRVQAVRASGDYVAVTLPATTSAFSVANIFARASGYIDKRNVDIGDHVKQGQLLAQITAPELDHQIQQAEANLSQTQATLRQNQANADLANVTWQRDKPLVDVRSPAEFSGEILAPPGLMETAQRGGHIPGAASIPWAIIRGRSETSLTIFRPTPGLDEGPVILQKRVAIGPNDTAASLYFDKIFPLGVEALLQAADLVVAGRATEWTQDEKEATYEGFVRDAESKINWANHVDFVYDLIRGCNPAPGAWSKLGDTTVKIFDAKPIPATNPKGIAGKLGKIVAVEADGITVVCADGRFKVTRVQPDGAKKIEAAEWAKSANIEKGAIFS